MQKSYYRYFPTDILDAFHLSLAEQAVDVGGDDDGIVVNDAEDGDEAAYPGCDAEVVAKKVLEPDAARNGRWNLGKDETSENFFCNYSAYFQIPPPLSRQKTGNSPRNNQ